MWIRNAFSILQRFEHFVGCFISLSDWVSSLKDCGGVVWLRILSDKTSGAVLNELVAVCNLASFVFESCFEGLQMSGMFERKVPQIEVEVVLATALQNALQFVLTRTHRRFARHCSQVECSQRRLLHFVVFLRRHQQSPVRFNRLQTCLTSHFVVGSPTFEMHPQVFVCRELSHVDLVVVLTQHTCKLATHTIILLHFQRRKHLLQIRVFVLAHFKI